MAKPNKKKPALQRVADQSPDMREELLDQLRAIAPDAFTEGQLDLGKLGQLTGNVAADGPERFSFTWAGKRDGTPWPCSRCRRVPRSIPI